MPSKQKQAKLELEAQDLHRKLEDLRYACQRLLQDSEDGLDITERLATISVLLGNRARIDYYMTAAGYRITPDPDEVEDWRSDDYE